MAKELDDNTNMETNMKSLNHFAEGAISFFQHRRQFFLLGLVLALQTALSPADAKDVQKEIDLKLGTVLFSGPNKKELNKASHLLQSFDHDRHQELGLNCLQREGVRVCDVIAEVRVYSFYPHGSTSREFNITVDYMLIVSDTAEIQSEISYSYIGPVDCIPEDIFSGHSILENHTISSANAILPSGVEASVCQADNSFGLNSDIVFNSADLQNIIKLLCGDTRGFFFASLDGHRALVETRIAPKQFLDAASNCKS